MSQTEGGRTQRPIPNHFMDLQNEKMLSQQKANRSQLDQNSTDTTDKRIVTADYQKYQIFAAGKCAVISVTTNAFPSGKKSRAMFFSCFVRGLMWSTFERPIPGCINFTGVGEGGGGGHRLSAREEGARDARGERPGGQPVGALHFQALAALTDWPGQLLLVNSRCCFNETETEHPSLSEEKTDIVHGFGNKNANVLCCVELRYRRGGKRRTVVAASSASSAVWMPTLGKTDAPAGKASRRQNSRLLRKN